MIFSLSNRLRRAVMCCALIGLAIMLCGCQGSGASLFKAYHLEDAAVIESAELQYVSESVGVKYVHVKYENGRDTHLQELLGMLLEAKEVEMPVNFQFNAPLNASHRLELTLRSGETLDVYYALSENLFIYIDSDNNIENRLTYRYLRPQKSPVDLLNSQRSMAVNPNENKKPTVDPSSMVLRASIEPEELTKEGVEVEFSLYGGAFIHDKEKPYYAVLTQDTVPSSITDIDEDRYLIVAAMGKPAQAGVLIDIESILSTERYVKITIAHVPAIDDEVPPHYPTAAVTVNKSDFPSHKIIVFVDEDNTILEAQKIN